MNEPLKQLIVHPVRGWRKWAFRAPLYLWRMGLDQLIGGRLMVLTATGRVSGMPRRVVLEPILIDGRLYVLSAWGDQAQWYKNVMADPHVTVQRAGSTMQGLVQRVTDEAELTRLFHHLYRNNPFWEVYLEMWDIRPTLKDILAHKDRLHVLRIDPAAMPAPPPMEADLRWVWGAVLAGVFIAGLVWRLVRRG